MPNGDFIVELSELAALRRELAPDRATLARQARFAARHRVSPAALEVALELTPPDEAALGAFVSRLAQLLPGTRRGGPVEDLRWWCVADGLVRKGFPTWAPQALTALGSCGAPAAGAAAPRIQAVIDKLRQQRPYSADSALVGLDDAIAEVGLSLMDVEDQIDAAIGAAGVDVERDEWYEAGMPEAPCPDLPARAPWQAADRLVVHASCALDDLGRVVCAAAVLSELHKPLGGDAKAALGRTAKTLADQMTHVLEETLSSVLAIDGPAETPLGYRLQAALSEPTTFVWATLVVAAAAALAWAIQGRR